MGDEPEAYAKIWGKKRDSSEINGYVTSLPTKLGRFTIENQKCQDIICVGETKRVSRIHATIDWYPKRKSFSITCNGKNGMIVNGMYYGRGGRAFVNSRSSIKIGQTLVQFILPGEKVDTTASNVEAQQFETIDTDWAKEGLPPPVDYADWVYECMCSPEYKDLAKTSGIPSHQILSFIIDRFPEFSGPECRKLLSNGIHNVLGRKCIKIKDESRGPKCFLWKISPALMETRKKERHSAKKPKTDIRDSLMNVGMKR
mmetsp:Transcript_7893/g.10388  ORF Transcript_7893/g.10388 Transcript_7893/m.10388 type:complete len:257 (+) Transcript_7893:122-892(+)|eukprot:CAMPEP_0117799260 /NCGR_PEP_ID=MMETSP0948-20121206/13668_1 /TAXON_ID=44440 /ORGANISM="Chattonella subsalsa, Strain CCMP2191" /LENGTH=256 /DNA_ID=CAMNT_0005631113 /DNA_START=44 /DNA_END=814 /DNA_ORIENTATION=-